MRVLADTHSLVWAVDSPHLLSPAALAVFENEEVYVSAASLWELCIKAGKRTSLVSDPVAWWNTYVTQKGVPSLPIRTSDVTRLCPLPEIHKDPFDRILVAQALSEAIPLVTKDPLFRRYGIPTIW